MPIIHKSKFQTALKLGPSLRPPLSLLYAIWSIAASASRKYRELDESLYQKSRMHAEAREMKGYDHANVTVYDAQCWHLIASFEAQKTYAARAFMSTGKCLRLVQIMGLHHIDRAGLNTTMIPAPAKDFIELEERRRTFWAAFIGDRWASICTGWPMTMDESEIFTNLPCSELAFNEGWDEKTTSLAEALAGDGASSLPSSFSGLAVAITLLGRNLTHIHGSPEESVAIKRADSKFWRRHREIDNTISNTFLYLPTRLKLPPKFQDPNAVFLSMTLQASSICLHLAAIRKSMINDPDSSFIRQSMDRCITGADAITATIRPVAGVDLSKVNSWTGFCLYVAGLVYCLNLNPDALSNLNFLLQIMKSIAECHPITEYFIAQLEHELS
ncbi:fungal-specific transcription factor domain-containing protein, partial [Leptodontidium sp. 2 PMI_412]